jgi:hypothetical protein
VIEQEGCAGGLGQCGRSQDVIASTQEPLGTRGEVRQATFPAWFFASHPRSNIIGVSHIATLAETNSGHVQRYINDNSAVPGYGLANDNKSHWYTTHVCEYVATGIGGTVRGFRADVIIIDDPINDREAAESETTRVNLWEYFHSDLASRLKPGGIIVLIGTPMHEDDLLCRLIREQGDNWYVLRLPAISEGEGDALDRPEGAPLWGDSELPLRRNVAENTRCCRAGRKAEDWYAQYQGRPRAREGAMFKPGPIRLYDLLPSRPLMTVRAWDLAASSSGDWTVGLKLSQCGHWQDNAWIVTDIRRMRGRPDEVRALYQIGHDNLLAQRSVDPTVWSNYRRKRYFGSQTRRLTGSRSVSYRGEPAEEPTSRVSGLVQSRLWVRSLFG